MSSTSYTTTERLIYPDVLRAAATVSVIILHVCGGMMWALTPDMWEFKWLASADTIVHCAVPLFLMLSGMFLLSPEKSVSLTAIFKKYILRLVFAYMVWSAVYAVSIAYLNGTLSTGGFSNLWQLFFDGRYHLWFIPMMIGVYLTTPFFRGITEKKDDDLLRYVVVVLMLFLVVYPKLADTLPNLHNVLLRINPSWFGIHAAYFFLGYFFSRVKVTKLGKYVWLGVLGISAVWLVYSVYSGSVELGTLDESKWSANQPSMVIYTVAVFMLFRNFGDVVERFPKLLLFLRKISEVSFIVYLCHDLFSTTLAYKGYHALTWHPVISVPVLTGAIFVASMFTAEVLLFLKMRIIKNIFH